MKRLILSIILILSFFIFAGCAEQDGPAGRAGEKIDQSIESSKDTMSDAAEEAAEKIEDAGDAIEDTAEDVGSGY